MVDSNNVAFKINKDLNVALMWMGEFEKAAKAKPCEVIRVGKLDTVFSLEGTQVSLTIENGNLVEYAKGPRSGWQVVRTEYYPVQR